MNYSAGLGKSEITCFVPGIGTKLNTNLINVPLFALAIKEEVLR